MSAKTKQGSETLVVGRITAVFGVRGWVKVCSYTEQKEALFDYQPWLVDTQNGRQPVTVDEWKRQGTGLVAHMQGVDDREVARSWCHRDILIDRSLLPVLSHAQIYWHQLEGLRVISRFEGREVRLGVVKCLLETGANDVLVIQGDADSIDRKERLVPYVEQFVAKVDLQAQTLDVIWDPEF